MICELSGDGAKKTRGTNFTVISYSILDTDEMLCHQRSVLKLNLITVDTLFSALYMY